MIFKFHNNYKKPPNRIIILGSSGIIASNLQKAFKKKKINIISIGSSKLDLRKKYFVPVRHLNFYQDIFKQLYRKVLEDHHLSFSS